MRGQALIDHVTNTITDVFEQADNPAAWLYSQV